MIRKPAWARLRFAATAVAACLLMATGAASAAPLEEITVTARKVEENLQDVPISITALTGDFIESAGLQNLEQVAAFTPGLTFFNPFGEFLPVPVIRGVAPTDIFGESNAAIFVDGVYVSGREGLNFNFLETERIEVVKGPQSALYGRNAFSGAINYVTKRPTQELTGKVTAIGGSDNRAAINAVISGPIIGEKFLGSLAIGLDNFDGTYDNPISNEKVGGRDLRTYLAALQWIPTDNLDILGKVYYSDDEIHRQHDDGHPRQLRERRLGRRGKRTPGELLR